MKYDKNKHKQGNYLISVHLPVSYHHDHKTAGAGAYKRNIFQGGGKVIPPHFFPAWNAFSW